MTAPARSPDPAAEAVSALREALEKFYASRYGAPGWQRQEVAYLMAANGPLAPLLADIAALRTCAEEYGEYIIDLEHKVFHEQARAEAITADRDRMADRVAALEAALKPFVFGDGTMETILYGSVADDESGTITIRMGDIRAARRAIEAARALDTATGEMPTARAVADGIAGKVRSALNAEGGTNDAKI